MWEFAPPVSRRPHGEDRGVRIARAGAGRRVASSSSPGPESRPSLTLWTGEESLEARIWSTRSRRRTDRPDNSEDVISATLNNRTRTVPEIARARPAVRPGMGVLPQWPARRHSADFVYPRALAGGGDRRLGAKTWGSSFNTTSRGSLLSVAGSLPHPRRSSNRLRGTDPGTRGDAH